MKMLTLIVFVAVFVMLITGARCEAETAVRDVRAALQNRQFEDAVKLADSLLATTEKDQDFLTYLKTLPKRRDRLLVLA